MLTFLRVIRYPQVSYDRTFKIINVTQQNNVFIAVTKPHVFIDHHAHMHSCTAMNRS